LLEAFPPLPVVSPGHDASNALTSPTPPEAGIDGGPHDPLQTAPVGQVALVVSDVEDAPALRRARAAGVTSTYVPWRTRADRPSFEGAVQHLFDEHGIDLVCLAGFMRILSPSFVTRWSGRILNVHPSLLPKFAGLEPQRRALEAGEAVSGCTVHFVDAGVDTGPRIVQRAVEVEPGDTVESLTARILRAEHVAYPEAVRLVLRGAAVHPRPS